jgi:hypothetical protein
MSRVELADIIAVVWTDRTLLIVRIVTDRYILELLYDTIGLYGM